MAYACPKCGGAVSRQHNSGVQQAGGLVGALIFAALASLTCAKCGKLAKTDFSAQDRATMTRNSALMVVGALVLFGVCIGAIVALN